ncbi:MAG: zinc-binding dehydrogenase, partial [Burkholderiaceae bacterium]|nr:zinc-binding dehydrogenase [Burkholderiaceae bacterium]
MGRTVNGGFAEYMVAPAANIVPIPDHLNDEEAAIIPCSVATAYHAVRRAGLGEGQSVAIFGIGGIGLNAVQFASMAGAEVIAVDMAQSKLELARSLGARHCVKANSLDVVAEIKRITGDLGPDATLECIGSPSTYQSCIDSVRRGGRVVVAGFHPDPLKVNPLRLMLDEVTITGAHVANRSEIEEIVGLLSDRTIDLRRMVTHTLDFRDIHQGFERLRTQEGDPIRIVVRF